jgi:PadR family transcriptional regulator AphA
VETISLTTTEYAVLGLLAFGERSGYDLARAADRSIAYIWAPSRSQIYKVLPRLVERGLATRREVAQRGLPDKAVYRVTDAGRDALREWIAEVEPEPPSTAVFLLKVLFGDFGPEEAAIGHVEAYRDLMQRRLAEFEEIDRNPAPERTEYGRIALHHGIARVRATVEWAEAALASLAVSRRS